MEYKELIHRQRTFFRSGATRSVSFRKTQLVKLYHWICENEDAVMEALGKDLNKSAFESYATEIGIVKEELRYAAKNLDRWARIRKVPTPITQFPAVSFRYPEPYGVVLIMAPWNYPFQLTMAPLIGAAAAGNCIVIKPSAYSVHTSALIAGMIRELFPEKYIAVIEGGRNENEFLLNEKFDYIFFTGSVSVGKTVMHKAAEHLTPVSLELGGKSPCIVDETADIALAARRIVWGKLLNSGQTCVAPDYILVHRSVKDKLVRQMIRVIRKMYGPEPLLSDDYPKMINEKHFRRVQELMKSGRTVFGGAVNKAALQIEPTILEDVTWEDPVMKEEIFGPIFPIIPFYGLQEAVEMVNAGAKPLALYYFTRDKKKEARILGSISHGGGCINDTVVHIATVHMPFGGVGESGMGGYHGKAGFDTFTHYKSIMKKSLAIDIPLRYAPFTEKHLRILRKLQ